MRLLMLALVAIGLTVAEARAAVVMSMPLDAYGRTLSNGFQYVRTPLNAPLDHWTVAGRYEFRVETPPGELPVGPLFTYCLDVSELVQLNPTTYNVTSIGSALGTSNLAIGTRLRQLVHVVGSDPWNPTVFSNLQAWAFQMAVWEIVHETAGGYGTYNVGPAASATNNFYMLEDSRQDPTDRAKVINQANAWLALLSASTQEAGSLVALDPGLPGPGDGQPQAILLPEHRLPPPSEVVPEPSGLSIWAGLALIGGALQYRRRRRAAG